jgi:hypothetical protein
VKNEKATRPFVLYSLPYIFLTRLGESGCDAWTLARIAGHSNVAMSSQSTRAGWMPRYAAKTS